MEHKSNDEVLLLPVSIVGRIDVGRLQRETELIDSFMAQAAIREPGSTVKMPRMSRIMDEIVSINKLNLLQGEDRTRLMSFLMTVRRKAPVLHMSFSSDPAPLFLQRLVTWIRREIHPLILIQVGLQPTIGAGCVVRTSNVFFDMSLRSRLIEKRQLLVDRLQDINSQDSFIPTPAPKEFVGPGAPE